DPVAGHGQVDHTAGHKYEFRRGLLTTAHFGQLTVAAARAFVRAAQTRFVRELFIGGAPHNDEFEPGPDVPDLEDAAVDPAFHALWRWPGWWQIRRFQFGWGADEVYDAYCKFRCNLSGDSVYEFVRRMPEVEELLVFAHLELAAGELFALP